MQKQRSGNSTSCTAFLCVGYMPKNYRDKSWEFCNEGFKKMSDPVLSQLVTVENDLSQQVENLESKLAAIQEQKEGLLTVINMFEPSEEGADKGAVPQSLAPQSKDESQDAGSVDQSAASENTDKVASKTTGKKVGRPAARKVNSPKATSATKTKTKAKTKATGSVETAQKPNASNSETIQKKKDGRAADWQKYVQPDYEEAALPESVSIVLRSQPSEVFTIADVMSSIFTEEMPRDAYLKARNRISNILSAGARDGTWYKGRNGRYSQSESVTKSK